MAARLNRPLPCCQYPGCWNRVKGHNNKFCCPAHVPREVRAENCRRGRKTFAYRRRAQSFRADLDRLDGRRITREELLAVFQTVYQRAYNSGFQAGKAAGQHGDQRALARAQERGAA